MKKKRCTDLPTSVAGLSPLELARKNTLAEAAEINGIHVDTFRRCYPHLLKRVGRRLLMVTLFDAITLPPDTNTSGIDYDA
jgi:hypothetical protein